MEKEQKPKYVFVEATDKNKHMKKGQKYKVGSALAEELVEAGKAKIVK